MTIKLDTPTTAVILSLGYEHYVFESAEKAAKVIDLLSSATVVEHDWRAPTREDCVSQYYVKPGAGASLELKTIVVSALPYLEPATDL
jgi:hypothetical protein